MQPTNATDALPVNDLCKCELCGDEAYGMIDGLVAICFDCDTSCGSYEPSAEVIE